jgi:LCP family protein required for cell wall assembly
MDIIKRKKNESSDPYSFCNSSVKKNAADYLNSETEKANASKDKHVFSKRFLTIAAVAIVAIIIALGSYFILKISFVGGEMNIENENFSVLDNVGSLISSLIPNHRKILRGEGDGRINVLLLGKAGKGKPGGNLTDTIMTMSIDTKNKKISLLSLPRDFYANIPETSYYTKINSIYQYGISNKDEIGPIKKTVEEITGNPIHYFMILDFDGFKKIIDDIGGVNVTVERDIYDASYPGPNYSYETFEIKKGTHLLNGETALKYVRERHDDPEGDFGRAKRQQQVMQSAKNKVFSLKTFLNPITLNNILNDLGDNVKTDVGLDEIEGFIDLSKKCDTQNITNIVVDAWKKDSILKVSHVFAKGVRAFVLVPRVGNYSEIQELSENIFDLNNIRRRKTEMEKENASVTIVNQSSYSNLAFEVKDILENQLGMKDIKIAYVKNSGSLEKTFVYDNTGGKKIFTLDEIIKKLGIGLGKNNSAIIEEQKSDLVLVLGNDLSNIGSFEEVDVEEFRKVEENQEYFELIKK